MTVKIQQNGQDSEFSRNSDRSASRGQGWRQVRGFWRWLTSMRTALVLLLVLAVAAVPGSIWPQRSVSREAVARYFAENPSLAPFLDRLWAFDVYASPWFSAVYLLLFVSLVGCLLPRLRQHAQSLVKPPPDAPARLARLAHHTSWTSADDPTTAAQAVRSSLRGKGSLAARNERGAHRPGLTQALRGSRWRTALREGPDSSVTVAAEKGYLKETGNLVFHFALLALLIGIAWGSWYGWHGNRLLVVGDEFCDTLQQYDEYGLGARAVAEDLPPFCVRLQDFAVEFRESGQAASYTAQLSYEESPGAPTKEWTLRVNHPLRVAGASVYLLDHGYAPILRYTDRYGTTFESSEAFLPRDAGLTSEGVAKFPYANVPAGATPEDTEPAQLGLAGVYQPTANPDPAQAVSIFPAERDPVLTLTAWQGDLGLASGSPQSVFALDRRQIDLGRLQNVGTTTLRPGESWTLPDGSIVEFLGTRQWIAVSVRHDPGTGLVLGGAVALLLGLMVSLSGKRRRVWARIVPAEGGGSVITFGGLARTEYPGFAEEFATTAARAAGPTVDEPPIAASRKES